MMSNSGSQMLFVDFTRLSNWGVQNLLNSQVSYSAKYKLAKIGDFLRKSRQIINIQDETLYKRITVKINNRGVVLRDVEQGANIGTKKQFIAKAGQFIISKIDARNGAFGIIPDNLQGAIVTNDFPLFDVDVNKINPYFLLLITTTKEFIQFAQSCSSGTTNRQRMDIDMFLNQTIPLPELTEQNRIVRNHRAKIELSQKLQFEAQMLEEEIEHYFLGRLGLPPLHLKLKQITLQITDYASLDRWDFFSTDTRILIELKKSDFELSSIGKSYRFAKRSFNRARYLKSTFKYIEIGAIDPIQGILEAKDIEVKNTPSRATQIVKEGDLIIGLTRPYLKKFAIVTEMYDSNVCSSGFSIIEKSDRYHLPYLQQFLKCVYGIEQLKNKMTGGLYPAITEGQLKEIKIPLPEIKIQKDIMESIDRKKAKIVKNRVLSASVIHDAVQEFETIIFK